MSDLAEVLMTIVMKLRYRLNNYALRLFPNFFGLLFILVALVIIYIVASGPILYLILKYKDKREWLVYNTFNCNNFHHYLFNDSSSSIRNL